MGLNKIKGSQFESSENFNLNSTADLATIVDGEKEGIVIVGGTGGGTFIYSPNLSQDNHNGGTIFSASETQNAEDLGCWVRLYAKNQGSLEWFGSDNTTVTNLTEARGVEGLLVYITDPTLGGTFQFSSAEVGNHDGVNNFNGWVRVNDGNFTTNINMNSNRITALQAGVANTDACTVEQAVQLANTGNHLGIIPQVSQVQIADGITNVFDSEADGTEDPSMLVASAFEVYINGERQQPDLPGFPGDYGINAGTGNVEFNFVPAEGVRVQVIWFAPILTNDLDDLPVTADNQAVTQLMSEWVGSAAGSVLHQRTGATATRTLQQIIDSLPVYFDNEADLLANYGRAAVNNFVCLYGNSSKGDGGFAHYYLITKAAADTDGIDYSAESPNIFIPGPGTGWVAVYQAGTQYALSFTSKTLAAGQTAVTFDEPIINGVGYISGVDVDRGQLREGLDYEREADGISITLTESYPAGTVVSFQLPTVRITQDQAADIVVLDLTAADSPYTIPSTFNYTLKIDTTGLAGNDPFVINTPLSPRDGQRIEIRDAKGNFATNPVEFTPAVGQTVIDDTLLTIDFPFLKMDLLYDEAETDWGI